MIIRSAKFRKKDGSPGQLWENVGPYCVENATVADLQQLMRYVCNADWELDTVSEYEVPGIEESPREYRVISTSDNWEALLTDFSQEGYSVEHFDSAGLVLSRPRRPKE